MWILGFSYLLLGSDPTILNICFQVILIYLFKDCWFCPFLWCCWVLSKTKQHVSACNHPVTTHLCAALCSSPFPPSTFHLCSVGRSAVTQGCHTQEKLPSNNMEGCKASVYSPPPHLMHPLPLSLSLSSSVVEMEWHGRIVKATQPPALWLIQTTDTEKNWDRRRRGEV